MTTLRLAFLDEVLPSHLECRFDRFFVPLAPEHRHAINSLERGDNGVTELRIKAVRPPEAVGLPEQRTK